MAALREALLAEDRSTGSDEGRSPIPSVIPSGIHVTGSNGKGTVACLTAAILRQLGVSSLLFTSPHFVRFEERFQLDGQPVPAAELEASASRVLKAVESYRERFPDDEIAGFEALTAVALDLSLCRQPRVVVAEAGIGGRFDSTRVFPGAVAALTSLELEHRELLGPGLVDIALDKSELCRDGEVLVAGEIDLDVQRRVAGALALRGGRLVPVAEELRWKVHDITPERMRLDLTSLDGSMRWEGLELGVVGLHQAANAAVAVQLVREWMGREPRSALTEELPRAVRDGLAGVWVPGRFQHLESAKLWGSGDGPEEANPDLDVFVDVAHTPASLVALAETVKAAFGDRPRVLVLGLSQGRDPDMLRPLMPGTEAVVCTSSRYRGEDANRLLSLVPDDFKPQVEMASGLDASYRAARKLAGALRERTGSEPVILVTGSYFLAAEVAALVAGEDPAALGFSL